MLTNRPTKLDDLPRISGAVATLGAFDGVHLGHQRMLSDVRERAKAAGVDSVVITLHRFSHTTQHTALWLMTLIRYPHMTLKCGIQIPLTQLEYLLFRREREENIYFGEADIFPFKRMLQVD